MREEGRTLASVDRALALLDVLAELPAGARVGELAQRTGINQSTVSRLLGTLMGRGFVDRDDATARYRLGLRLVAYADAVLAGRDVRTIARPHLERLAAQTGETTTLSVPGATQPYTIDFVPSPSNVASRAELGRPSVTHATVTGKLLLAFGPLPLDHLGPEPYERFTARTLTTSAELRREIDRVRAEGVAYGREERELGLNAVGAPVLGREQTLMAMLSIQGPANRLYARRLSGLASLLREAADEVGAALGGQP
ncbi:MAG TPA: IclR family transcriptional regulator [Solirubrobacteraceae bacterium]